jgi:hypothetical protein
MPERKRSTMDERAAYCRALLEHDAVGLNAVESKDIGFELGFSEAIRADAEHWTEQAGLVEFVGFGPGVVLTNKGRAWAEGTLPQGGSGTHVHVHENSNIIQAAGDNATQTMKVHSEAHTWAEDVRQWADVAGMSEREHERIGVRLEDFQDEPGPSTRDKLVAVLRDVTVSAAGSGVLMGLIEAGQHLHFQ